MGVSHHGEGKNERDELLKQSVLHQQFIDQANGLSKRSYPEGRIGADDEGGMAFAVAADPKHGVVRVEFTTAVEWLAMPPSQAVELAKMLIEKAREISDEPIVLH